MKKDPFSAFKTFLSRNVCSEVIYNTTDLFILVSFTVKESKEGNGRGMTTGCVNDEGTGRYEYNLA
jgi:hypothetical protein